MPTEFRYNGDFTARRSTLKNRILSGASLVVPGAFDAVSAKLVESAGFEAVYIGSYATAASRFGLADVGMLSANELVDHTRNMVNAVQLPVIADAENGFSHAANVWRVIQAFEQAGAAAIHIEDHEFGKHANVRQILLPEKAMIQKISAATDARTDPNFLIIARTDVMWVSGNTEETVHRANVFLEAGADMVFLAGCTPSQLKAIRGDIHGQVMVTDTPGYSCGDENLAGADVVIYYGLTLLASFAAIRELLNNFREHKNADHLIDRINTTKDLGACPKIHKGVPLRISRLLSDARPIGVRGIFV